MITSANNAEIDYTLAPKTDYFLVPKKVIGCACIPLTFGITKIIEANNYSESCSFPSKLILRFSLGAVFACIRMPFALTTLLVSDLAIRMLFGSVNYESMHQESPMCDGKTIDAMTVCVIAPIVEEIIFRWAIHYAIKKPVQFTASFFYELETANKIGAVAAIAISSLAFGLIHLSNSTNPLVALPQAINCTLSGVLAGIQKEYGGGIAMTIGSHMMNNSIVCVIASLLHR